MQDTDATTGAAWESEPPVSTKEIINVFFTLKNVAT
jgi:hypothetical protein